MILLPAVPAPPLGTWSAAISLAGVRLDQSSGLVLALNDATDDDVVAVYVSENGSLNPAVTGLSELAPLAPLPQVGGAGILAGPNPVAAPFSPTQPPAGTFVYLYRKQGVTAVSFQVAGQSNAASGPWTQTGEVILAVDPSASVQAGGGTASGTQSFAFGISNIASGPSAVVLGGVGCQATSLVSACLGGSTNTASGGGASCISGFSNTASGSSATVIASYFGLASGTTSAVIASNAADASALCSAVLGGASCIASAAFAVCVGGTNNLASGQNAVCIGGEGATAAGRGAVAIGNLAMAPNPGDIAIGGTGTQIGFLGAAPIARPTVTGSRGGNAALASLLTALATLGLLVDNSTP